MAKKNKQKKANQDTEFAADNAVSKASNNINQKSINR